MVNVVIMQHAGPDDYASGHAAIAAAQALVDSGAKVLQIFFYGPGVLYASHHLHFPSGVNNLQQQWLEFARTQHIPLVVCSTVANQYGIEPSAPPSGSMAAGFSSGGLTEFMAAISTADTLLQFQPSFTQETEAAHELLQRNSQTAKDIAKEPASGAYDALLLFEFNHSPWQAISRHGLDMLLMAVSLDIPCQAIYNSSALSQLILPTEQSGHDPLKRIAMLCDVFDFTEFYSAVNDMAAAGIKQYRVPLQEASTEQIAQMKASAKHHIIF
ncbi:DsrE/DsrF/TusD sulfur relay family protein [Aliidiomarina sp.]|uniref:DsrE/DsrF/TusD sulfur relay family protein n=1 Tax=Aliidiomarina sp. TaxID=1872439 RepID=UPI003A4DAD99